MALLTDNDFVQQADLAALDPEVPDVAVAEGITIEGEAGIARQAWEECATVLLERMESFGGSYFAAHGQHLYPFGAGSCHARVFLSQIVVSDPYARRVSPIERWMIYEALVLFYRAAVNRTIEDRYQVKLDRFGEAAKEHRKRLWRRGLPVVFEPLPAPGALHEWHSGVWSAANLSGVAGGANPETQYDVAITWVDRSRYGSPAWKGNAESGPSAVLRYALAANHWLQVDIGTLNPPAGGAVYQNSPADGDFRQLQATHWNLYVGLAGQPLWLQNASPIPVDAPVYALAGTPSGGGEPLEPGQKPDINYAFMNLLHRA